MGRWFCGLVAVAALVAGCASAAPGDTVQQQSNGDGDLGASGPFDFAGGVVVNMCVDGGSCTTGNPGDCNMGHAVCSGNVQSCVPDVTTQRCYDGPPGTIAKGICKAGSQTCIGAVGSCDGEVTPAAVENCFNDLDDDCDGVVNNGCPTALSTGTARALTAIGDSTAGTAFSLRCPTGSFVSKAQMWGDNNAAVLAVTALDVYCAAPTLVRGTSSYSVTVAVSGTPLSTGTDRPASPTTTFTCPGGFAPGWQTPGTGANGAGGGIDGFGLYCGSTTLALDATNKMTFSMTKVAASSSDNGMNPDGYQTATAFEYDCNQGEVLIGYDGRVSSYINYFQPICAPLTVTYK